jgi:hypothetical protein
MRPHRSSGRVLAAGWRRALGLAAMHTVLLTPLAAQDEPATGSPQDEIRKIREEMERMRAGYEARISELERQMKERPPAGAGTGAGDREAADELGDALAELDQALLQSDDPARTRLSQTTRFDDFFNPSISAVLDFSASASTLDDGWEDYDQFRFRVGEIGMAAELDPYARAYAVFEVEEEGAEVAEFAGIFDLARVAESSNGRFKVGRYFLDLDPLNRQHEHEYAFVHQPAVKIEMFGGNALGNGIEYHDWVPVGDSPLRFSLGIASDVEGHNHTERGGGHEHDEDEVEPFGSRGFEDLAYTARVAWNTDLSQDDRLTIGGMVFYAPRMREFELDPGLPEVTVAHDTRKLIESLDLTLQRNTPQGTGFTFTTAVFAQQGRFVDEATDARFDEVSYGGYAWYENRFDIQWGAGIAFDWTQSSTDDDRKLYQYSAFLNWYPSDTHRLRLQYQYTDTDPFDGARFEQDFHAVFLQWTIVLGAHNHGLNW